jgi:ComF family protein
MVYHGFECAWCRDTSPAFTTARSAVRFRGVIRDMLHDFKYNNQVHLALDLGNILSGCIMAHYADICFDGITYVPLHPRKQRERNFNQAALLAEEAGRRLKIDLLRGCLRRTRFTATQTHLNAAERKANVRGAFTVRLADWVYQRRILLIDDVMTTGATVNECAAALIQAGALSVHVATVARG